MNESETLDRAVKVMFIIVNGILWLALRVRLIAHWPSMTSRAHFMGIYLGTVFPALWFSLLRGNQSSLLFYATAAFGGVLLALISVF